MQLLSICSQKVAPTTFLPYYIQDSLGIFWHIRNSESFCSPRKSFSERNRSFQESSVVRAKKVERGATKYKNIWLLGNELCFGNKLQKETFYCFPLLGISKAAARRYSCLSPVLGKSSCLKSGWTTSFSKNFQLPFLIFPKPENKLYTKERFWDWKLTSCDVTFERSQQRAL